MKPWVESAVRMKIEEGKSWPEVYDTVRKKFDPSLKNENIRKRVRLHPLYKKAHGEQQQDIFNINQQILKVLDKEQTIEGLCKQFNISERICQAVIDDIKETGYDVIENYGTLMINKTAGAKQGHIKENWNGGKIIRFGLISDTHLGSMCQQLTHLNAIYDIFKSEGIINVYHCGDIVDGDDVYPGHKFEVHTFGADNQKRYTLKNYPQREGITTKFITGNHDLKWYTKDGYDIGSAIANERSDLIYLGQYFARVELTPKCILQLEHPLGKPAYAVSYKTQRKIDNIRGGDKPNILAEGHYHYSDYMFRRNVHAYCVPSFQGQTKFAKRLGLESDNGGYIIEINVDDEGTITKLTQSFYPFYKALEHDYEG